LDHADWQWITTEYQTGVEEGTGSRSSWRVVATDLSCLRIMMMMMKVNSAFHPSGVDKSSTGLLGQLG